jgi:hypothetical protein
VESNAEHTRLVVGGITSRRYKQLFTSSEGRILSQDQLLRAIRLIAIDHSIHKLLSRRRAEKWVRTPNRQVYGGTPLFGMIVGGSITLWELRLSLERQVSQQKEAERYKATTQPPSDRS